MTRWTTVMTDRTPGEGLRMIRMTGDSRADAEGRNRWESESSGPPGCAGIGRFVPPCLRFVPNSLLLRQAPRKVVSQHSSVPLPPPGTDANGGAVGDANGGAAGDTNDGAAGDTNGGAEGANNGGAVGDTSDGATGAINVHPATRDEHLSRSLSRKIKRTRVKT